MDLPIRYVKVFIGRFQPFHSGHLKTLRAAIDTAELVVVVIGSANAERSPKNPFTAPEREAMIRLGLNPAEREKVAFVHQSDNPGSDEAWVASVKKTVNEQARTHLDSGRTKLHITLVGCHKDASSYYLKLYKGWNLDLGPQSMALNATDVRRVYFQNTWNEPELANLPPATAAFLLAFSLYNGDAYRLLAAQYVISSQQTKEQTR